MDECVRVFKYLLLYHQVILFFFISSRPRSCYSRQLNMKHNLLHKNVKGSKPLETRARVTQVFAEHTAVATHMPALCCIFNFSKEAIYLIQSKIFCLLCNTGFFAHFLWLFGATRAMRKSQSNVDVFMVAREGSFFYLVAHATIGRCARCVHA